MTLRARWLVFISSEVDRTNSLVTRFLDFARPLAIKLEKTDLAQVIDQAVSDIEKHSPPLDVRSTKTTPRRFRHSYWMVN